MKTIYCIKNLVNDRVYIGSTKDYEKRMREHRNALGKSEHHNTHLQRAWDKYGEGCFEFSIVEEVESISLLIPREQYWFEVTGCTTREKGYNIAPIAGSCEGVSRTEEFKKNLSKKRLGPLNPNYGKTPSAETRRRMSESHLGEKNHMYGKSHTDEARKKMREADRKKGHKQTADHISKRISKSTESRRKRSSLTAEIVREIRDLREKGLKMRIIGEMFGISERHVHKIVHRTIWKDV